MQSSGVSAGGRHVSGIETQGARQKPRANPTTRRMLGWGMELGIEDSPPLECGIEEAGRAGQMSGPVTV